ncbi:InlB B-repeat-containing protein [Bacteroides sp.]
MKKITKTLCMLLMVCVSAAVQAAVGDDYLEGWNDNSNGKTPRDVGWDGPAGNAITWGTMGDNQVSWRTGIGSPVNNGNSPMLYTTLKDTKLNYELKSLPAGKIYQLTGKIWRRNGGSGSAAFNFAVASDIVATNALLQYTYTANGNGAAGSFTSPKFAVPADYASSLYLLWDVHVNSGNWDNAGIWGLELKELGDALTVTFDGNEGSVVGTQYLLKGADEKVVKPADPTREGYIFKGWFSDPSCVVAYDFSSPVTADITLYAGWQDIKEELSALVATAKSLLENGTEQGKVYLNGAIDAAQIVIDDSGSNLETITGAFNTLTAAIAVYQDASLAGLSVNGTAVNGFLASTSQYSYSLAPSVIEIPVVTATVNAECAVAIVTPVAVLPGNATVVVTAGNGDTKTYTIHFIYNYMAGWDADGDVSKSPSDAGWYTTDTGVTWADATSVNASTYQYRDNLGIGRVFIHPANNSVFSYPLAGLKAGKTYTFTCSSATMSGTRTTNFSVNTLKNGTGMTLGQESNTAAQWGKSTTDYSFSFVAPDNETCYLIWQTEGEGGERSFAFNFQVVENEEIVDSQTDVTERYLQNTDFEVSPIFTESNGIANGTQVNLGTELAQGYQISGWNMAITGVYGRSSTAKYGITFETIPAVLNDVNPPASDINGNADGHVLMISGGWNSEVIMTQNVTLPVGSYELVYDVLNQAPGKSLNANYFGFVPDDGTPIYSTTLDYGGQWTTEKIAFTLKKTTTGKISLGLKAINKISKDNAKLAVDNVKLISIAVNNTTLADAINSAKWILVPGCQGETYLQNAIDAAQAIYDRGNATVVEILQAVEDLEKAMKLYNDATLSDLQVNGTSIVDFSSEVFNYVHIIAPDADAIVTATATGAEAGAQVTVSDINTTTNIVTISVTSGKGEVTNNYTVALYSDYMSGWDASGDVTKSPYDAGWRTTDESVVWTPTPGSASSADKYQYRDNLGVGRVFIHPKNDSKFSYPVKNLKAGKMYTMSCFSAKMSGEGTRTTTFSINTKEDGTGATLASVSKEAAKWTSYTDYSLSFVTPDDGTFYVIWQTQATDNGDRSLAWGFKLIQTGEAIEITFDSNGGTEVEPQYLAWGDKIIEPEVPVKDGYVFNGWWYDEDGFASKWNFEVGVEKNMLLEARWTDATALNMNTVAKPFEVLTVPDGVKVKVSQTMEVRVVSIAGQVVKVVAADAGETFIPLPAGMYIVNGVKTIVK